MMPLSKPEQDVIVRIEMRKRMMKLKGVRTTDFDVDHAVVSRVINEKQPNPRLREEIADRLGLPYKKVWHVNKPTFRKSDRRSHNVTKVTRKSKCGKRAA